MGEARGLRFFWSSQNFSPKEIHPVFAFAKNAPLTLDSYAYRRNAKRASALQHTHKTRYRYGHNARKCLRVDAVVEDPVSRIQRIVTIRVVRVNNTESTPNEKSAYNWTANPVGRNGLLLRLGVSIRERWRMHLLRNERNFHSFRRSTKVGARRRP